MGEPGPLHDPVLNPTPPQLRLAVQTCPSALGFLFCTEKYVPYIGESTHALLKSGGDHTRESEEEYFRLLGIVRIVATDMRGACDVAIRSDGGATFSLYLPIR